MATIPLDEFIEPIEMTWVWLSCTASLLNLAPPLANPEFHLLKPFRPQQGNLELVLREAGSALAASKERCREAGPI